MRGSVAPLSAVPAAANAVFVEPPAPTTRARARFAWNAATGVLLSLLFSPLLVLHSAFQPTAATFVLWMRPWARTVLRAWGLRMHIEARAPLPEGPLVYAANHQNMLDVVATSAGLPRPFLYVARHELRAWPIIGWVLEKTACLFIDRSHPRRSLVSLKAAAERVRAGESVMLFPEGGRSYRHRTDEFMRGAFLVAIEAGVPVVPVALIGHSGVMDERTHAARTGRICLVMGAPIPTAGLTRADSGALAEQVRASIEGELSRFG